MDTPETKTKRASTTLFIFTLILAVGFSRYLPLCSPVLFNFSPVIAIFLFCGAYLRGSVSWIAPVLAIFVSDLLLNPSYGKNLLEPYMVVTLLSYALFWLLGKKLGKTCSFKNWLGGAILSALLFHVLTCSFAWIINPAYSKTISGLVQATILGELGYAPSYLFLRNCLLSTVFFSLSFRWVHIWLTSLSTEKRCSEAVSVH